MRLTRKFQLIAKAGGACRICGYNKNISSLVFHHVHEKGSKLNGAYLITMTVEAAEEEIERCILVCHNCHFEIHNPGLDMSRIEKMNNMITNKTLTLSEAYAYFFPTITKKRKK